jgi:hypothetical protein
VFAGRVLAVPRPTLQTYRSAGRRRHDFSRLVAGDRSDLVVGAARGAKADRQEPTQIAEGQIGRQVEYAHWLEALLETTRESATGEAPRAMVDLDLEEIVAIQPPRGFGRAMTFKQRRKTRFQGGRSVRGHVPAQNKH